MNKFYACLIVLLTVMTGSLWGAAEQLTDEARRVVLSELALLEDTELPEKMALPKASKKSTKERPHIPALNLGVVDNQAEQQPLQAIENTLAPLGNVSGAAVSVVQPEASEIADEQPTERWMWPISKANRKMALGHLCVKRTIDRTSVKQRAITDLLRAAHAGNWPAVIVELDQNRLDVDCTIYGGNGMTALHYAVEQVCVLENVYTLEQAIAKDNYYRLMEELMARGANPDLPNADGVTPRMSAERLFDVQTVAILNGESVEDVLAAVEERHNRLHGRSRG